MAPSDGTRLVMLGPPGAGKGTQAVRLGAALTAPHIATGDLFRGHVGAETPLGRTAKAHMDRGELVPNDIVINMVTARLCEPDAASGFILDGFPRTVAQARSLQAFLHGGGRPLDGVLRFDIAEEEVVRRIIGRRVCVADGRVYHVDLSPPQAAGRCDLCDGELVQRDDDTAAIVRKRLEEYRSKTAPLEAFYAQSGLLVNIAASGPVAAVTQRAVAAVQQLTARGAPSVDRVVDVTESSSQVAR